LRARLEREQAKRKRGEPTLPSSVGEERSTNPFLRTSEAEVCAAAARHAGRDLPDRVANMPELRTGRARSDAGERLESVDSGAIPPSASSYWPASCLKDRGQPSLDAARH
jgi:hypothetical protein